MIIPSKFLCFVKVTLNHVRENLTEHLVARCLFSSEEKHSFDNFINFICSFDPDILFSWDIHGGSFGFLAEKGSHLDKGLHTQSSRSMID